MPGPTAPASARLRYGARGWEHPGWAGTFYPDDLPPQWRLAYYANEFATVLVPWERWIGAPAAELAGWVEETGERFRFLLEVADAGRAAGRPEAAAALGPRFGGWVPAGPWPAGAAAMPLVTEGGRLALFPAGLPPPELRARLEGLAATSGGDGFAIVTGTPTAAELHRVGTLVELLGY